MKERNTLGDPIPVLQESPPSRETARRTQELTHEVVVNFYRRMTLNRVFPIVVELRRVQGKQAVATSSPVNIRPIVPGAQVTPEQREIHPGNADALTTFYVTPLARGTLRDAGVGISQDGRLLEEVKLPMKGVRQRTTWILLALTILLPCLLHYFTTAVDLSTSAASARSAEAKLAFLPRKKMPRAEGDSDAGSAREREMGQRMAAGMRGMARAPDGNAPPTELPLSAVPHGVLEHEINRNIPELRISGFPPIRQSAAHGIQEGYEFLQDWEKELHLSRYLLLLLLGLTVVSWLTHSSRQSRRQAGPIALGP